TRHYVAATSEGISSACRKSKRLRAKSSSLTHARIGFDRSNRRDYRLDLWLSLIRHRQQRGARRSAIVSHAIHRKFDSGNTKLRHQRAGGIDELLFQRLNLLLLAAPRRFVYIRASIGHNARNREHATHRARFDRLRNRQSRTAQRVESLRRGS